MNDRFGIAVCVEGMTELLQLFAKLAVVVNLAVENYPGSAILIVDWLVAALDVDDREPAHSQAGWTTEIETIIVRAAMLDGIAHSDQQRLINIRSITINYAYNSAHV